MALPSAVFVGGSITVTVDGKPLSIGKVTLSRITEENRS